MLRAKFKCDSVTDYGDVKEVSFSAVSGAEGENMDFNKYTPSGVLKMLIDNPETDGFFEPKKEYYLNFEKA